MPPATNSAPSGLSCTFLAIAFRTFAKRVATVLKRILGVTDRGFARISRGILGLAVEILHGAFGLASALQTPRPGIACDTARRTFDLAGKILYRTGNPILIHHGHSLSSSGK